MDTIRIGIIGLGANTKLRHVPGLRACPGVEIVGVCNRRRESTSRAAAEFDISKTYDDWHQLVEDPDIDAVVIGTWPYLHCEITLHALQQSKHVLTEARMAMNADEARQMLAAARERTELTTQIVPSPLGLRGGDVVRRMIRDGFLGELREAVVLACNNSVADPTAPLHWRQSAEFSGLNMLALGIVHEPLVRWIPDPTRVVAQTHTFVPRRMDSDTGEPTEVGTPDSVLVWTDIPAGAKGLYHLSGVTHHGPGIQIHLYGTEGTIKYELAPNDKLYAATKNDPHLSEVDVPSSRAGTWRVEEEFIDGIRGIAPVQLNDFETGLRYMQFTEAVARSAAGEGTSIHLPLERHPAADP